MKKIKNYFLQLSAKHIYTLITILFSVIVTLIIVLIIKANNMAHNNPTRIAAINEIISSTTSAHLWFEEVITGDTNEKYDFVKEHINITKKYTKDLLEQNEDDLIKAITDKDDLKFMQDIQKQLQEFYTITNVRFENMSQSQIGSDIDQVYDTIFKDIVDELHILKRKIGQDQKELKDRFTTIQYMILLFEIISFALVSLAIYSYTKNKESVMEKDKVLIRQSKMVILGEMIENIAHQWRQPLSFISTMASSIQMEKENNMLKEEKLVDNMESILTNVNYLSQTIEDFRDFYKSDKNKKVFYIDDALDNIFKIVRFDKKHNQIEYIKNEYSNIEIRTYKNELLQVLINIINNAKDQLTDNKQINLKEKVVYISAKQTKNHNIITIHDNGGGVDEKIIDKIFDAYFTSKEDQKGTGIGLYISNDIVLNHLFGSIKVKNEPLVYKNKEYLGAKFIIKFPIR